MTDMKTIKEQTKEVKDRLSKMKRSSDQIDLSRVITEIKRVRRSGERPRETIGDTDLFVFECELCLRKIKEGELTQCAYCGRWVCLKQCYSTVDAACISCESMIRLKRESVEHIKEILKLTDIRPTDDGHTDDRKGEEKDHG